MAGLILELFIYFSLFMQLLEEKHRERIFGPHKKILHWIENVKAATNPHFEEVHVVRSKREITQ